MSLSVALPKEIRNLRWRWCGNATFLVLLWSLYLCVRSSILFYSILLHFFDSFLPYFLFNSVFPCIWLRPSTFILCESCHTFPPHAKREKCYDEMMLWRELLPLNETISMRKIQLIFLTKYHCKSQNQLT